MSDAAETPEMGPQMGNTAKAIWIKWYPKEALDGMVQLEPLEELAYRRLLDLIYVTGNRVVDDDRRLGRMTKTGRRWKQIKTALLAFEKIYVKDGLIRNKKCDAILAQYGRDMAQKSAAGKSSAGKRKGLSHKKTTSTNVGVVDVTTAATETARKKESQSLDSSPKGEGACSPKKPILRRKRSALPDDWTVPPEWLEAAKVHAAERGLRGIDWADEAAGFYAYHTARGSMMALWKSAWTTWVRNAVKWSREGASGKARSAKGIRGGAMADAFGRLRDDLKQPS
jgi:uncharacterized protein YdaU (DUF1376 family)